MRSFEAFGKKFGLITRYPQVVLALVVLFFFLRLGQTIFAPLGPHGAYVIDQLTLPIIALVIAWRWILRVERFRLGWPIIIAIGSVTLIAHFISFNRTFFYDEFTNIFTPMNLIDQFGSNPPVDVSNLTRWREMYAWGPFALLFKTVGLLRPYSVEVFVTVGMAFLTAAALAGAWLAGILTKNRLVALIAGGLIGISPNTFGSLPWISNIQGDSLAIILSVATVGTWYLARSQSNSKGILIALLLLAATLKGGGVVRTAMIGGMLVVTDVLFFPHPILKRWKQWGAVVVIMLLFYLLNPALHALSTSQSGTFAARMGYLAEATTRTFIPPTLQKPMLDYLHQYFPLYTLVIPIGAWLFGIGTLLAIAFYLKKRFLIFTWGWIWFWLTIFYVPALAVGFGTKLEQITDKWDYLFAGYKYAYLPLVGVYLALAVLLGLGITLFWQRRAWVASGALALLVLLLFWFRVNEFIILEKNWQTERSIPDKAVLETLTQTLGRSPGATAIYVAHTGRDPLINALESNHIQNALYPWDSIFVTDNFAEITKSAYVKVYRMQWDQKDLKVLVEEL